MQKHAWFMLIFILCAGIVTAVLWPRKPRPEEGHVEPAPTTAPAPERTDGGTGEASVAGREAWPDEAARRGERVHALTLDVVRGKATDCAAARAEEEARLGWLKERIATLTRRAEEPREELLLEYLEWEQRSGHALAVRHMELVEDPEAPPATKAQILLEEARDHDEQRRAWRERLRPSAGR